MQTHTIFIHPCIRDNTYHITLNYGRFHIKTWSCLVARVKCTRPCIKDKIVEDCGCIVVYIMANDLLTFAFYISQTFQVTIQSLKYMEVARCILSAALAFD